MGNVTKPSKSKELDEKSNQKPNHGEPSKTQSEVDTAWQERGHIFQGATHQTLNPVPDNVTSLHKVHYPVCLDQNHLVQTPSDVPKEYGSYSFGQNYSARAQFNNSLSLNSCYSENTYAQQHGCSGFGQPTVNDIEDNEDIEAICQPQTDKTAHIYYPGSSIHTHHLETILQNTTDIQKRDQPQIYPAEPPTSPLATVPVSTNGASPHCPQYNQTQPSHNSGHFDFDHSKRPSQYAKRPSTPISNRVSINSRSGSTPSPHHGRHETNVTYLDNRDQMRPSTPSFEDAAIVSTPAASPRHKRHDRSAVYLEYSGQTRPSSPNFVGAAIVSTPTASPRHKRLDTSAVYMEYNDQTRPSTPNFDDPSFGRYESSQKYCAQHQNVTLLGSNEAERPSTPTCEVASFAKTKAVREGVHDSSPLYEGNIFTDSRDITQENTICLAHLENECSADDCCYHHKDRIYQWQYQLTNQSGQDVWLDFDDNRNEFLENRFCDPQKEHCCIPLDGNEGVVRVSLKDMSVEGSNHLVCVRRLSTPSSEACGISFDNSTWLTVWMWYWQESEGVWLQYGQKKRKGQCCSVDSTRIERSYQENPKGSIIVSIRKSKHQLNFSTMDQEHLKDRAKFRIRRRPQFVRHLELPEPN